MGDFIENQYANNTKSTYINSIGYLELTPIAGLKLRSQLSTTLSDSRLGQYWGSQANANQPSYASSPYAQKTHDNGWSYTWENILSYNADIKDHSFGAQFITSYNKNTNEQTIAGSGGFLVDSLAVPSSPLRFDQSLHILGLFPHTENVVCVPCEL